MKGEYKERFTEISFRVQRNGVTDRVNVGMGEELNVEEAESIEIIEVDCKINK